MDKAVIESNVLFIRHKGSGFGNVRRDDFPSPVCACRRQGALCRFVAAEGGSLPSCPRRQRRRVQLYGDVKNHHEDVVPDCYRGCQFLPQQCEACVQGYC